MIFLMVFNSVWTDEFKLRLHSIINQNTFRTHLDVQDRLTKQQIEEKIVNAIVYLYFK